MNVQRSCQNGTYTRQEHFFLFLNQVASLSTSCGRSLKDSTSESSVRSGRREGGLITISSATRGSAATHVHEDIPRVTCQQFAIRNTFSSRCIRHTSFSHLIHHGAATALGSASPRRRKCSLLHVKVRSGCQRDTTNAGLRANVTTTTGYVSVVMPEN